MTYRRFNAVCEALFLRIIDAQPTPDERLAFAAIAHQHNQISDAALERYEKEAERERA